MTTTCGMVVAEIWEWNDEMVWLNWNGLDENKQGLRNVLSEFQVLQNGIQENKEKWMKRGESVYVRTIRIILIWIK